MALPFVAVGLLYRHGYFRQTIDADGHQEHAYPDYDLTRLPVGRVQGRDGEPLRDPEPILQRLDGIVLLDGSWKEAKTLWWRNPWLLKLHRIVLDPPRPTS